MSQFVPKIVTSTAIETRSSQSIKIGIDLSIDKSIKIGKSDLIDIDCIGQSVEIDGGGGGDDNQAMFHSISLICVCHQSPFVVMLFLYQICFCFYYAKVNKTQVIYFILFYFISFANII